MATEFRTIPWLGDDYCIGSNGTVWSHKRGGCWKRRKLTALSKVDPRPGVCINLNGKVKFYMVCHLVLEAFVGPRPEGMEACHFPDRDVTNNRTSNLRWDTRKNNFKDRDYHRTTVRGEKHFNAKLTEDAVRDIRASYVPGRGSKSVNLLAQKYGVDSSLIYLVLKRQIWKHV